MNSTIKFSHDYKKLPHILISILLLDILKVNLEDLSQAFLDYHTSYLENQTKQNQASKSREYLLILPYQKETNQLFTTLQRYEPQKYEYYKSEIGQNFNIDPFTTCFELIFNFSLKKQ
ncbi:MAG: hypothetical protein N3A69_16270 [Leptospiraceae bacterium]|nr:hypothetical protein [Leptospiraceae bacterium]